MMFHWCLHTKLECKVSRDSVETSAGKVETFTLLCGKYTQNSVYQISSNQLSFVQAMTKTFWCVFSVHSVFC